MGDSEVGEIRQKKYYEGWVLHQSGSSRGVNRNWNRYWMVLRAEYLYIFKNDKTTDMIGSLHLGPDTHCQSLPSSKKNYKLEVITVGQDDSDKTNIFKFATENERDIWKAYMVGISVGIVPHDVHLLPGQLRDVHMVMNEVRNSPPPLPTIPRPKVAPTTAGLFRSLSREDMLSGVPPPPPSRPFPDGGGGNNNTNHRYNGSSNNDSGRYNDDSNSSHSGSFRSHLTRRTQQSSSTALDPASGVMNLRQLHNRQRDLAFRSLDGPNIDTNNRRAMSPPPPPMGGRREREMSPAPRGRREMSPAPRGRREMSPAPRSREMSPPPMRGREMSPPPMGRREMSPAPMGRRGMSPPPPPMGRAMSPPPPPMGRAMSPGPSRGYEDSQHDAISDDSGYSQHPNEIHLFFTNPDLNRDTPTWFFDNMPREDAETVLTCGRRFGNVLMRPSSTFTTTNKYVISMRREVAGGTNLNHYEVIRDKDGNFKINVDNKHPSKRCLSEVMDFFTNVAGAGTKPFTTNNMAKIMTGQMTLRSNSRSSPTLPPAAPPPPLTSPMDTTDRMNRMAENSFDFPTPSSPPPTADNNWSFGTNDYRQQRSQSPSSTSWSRTNEKSNQLNITGNVSSGIQQTVSDMNRDLGRTYEDGGQSAYTNVNNDGTVPHQNSYGWQASNSAGGYGRQNSQETWGGRGGASGYGGGANNFGGGGGSVPPPPPIGGFGSPALNQTVPAKQPPSRGGPYGRQGEFNGNIPPPPPFTPPTPARNAGIPQPPPINSQGYNTINQPSSPQQPVQPAFHTTPNRGAQRAPVLDFESELRGRLVGQREQIYASGATVHRSNNWQ